MAFISWLAKLTAFHGVLIMTHPIQLFLVDALGGSCRNRHGDLRKKTLRNASPMTFWFIYSYVSIILYIYKYTCIYLHIWLVFTPSYIILYMLDIQIWYDQSLTTSVKHRCCGATGTEVWTHRPTGLLRQGGGDDSWRVRRVRKLDILYKTMSRKQQKTTSDVIISVNLYIIIYIYLHNICSF